MTPERDEEREALARKVFELMTHGGQITEGERLRKDSRSYAIADFILAHTAKEVEAARRGFADQLKLAMIDGKASHSVSRINEIIDQELAAAENFDHLNSQRKGDNQ